MAWAGRPGVADDAAEFVRLRRLMFEAMGEVASDSMWEVDAARAYRHLLAEGVLLVSVVDAPRTGLAAAGVALVVTGLPSPRLPDGRRAHVSSMSTDPRWRRQGLARLVLVDLLGRLDDAGIRLSELHATTEGAGLYRGHGFDEGAYPHLRRRVSPQQAG